MSDQGPVEVILGAKYGVRLADLRERQRLDSRCIRCGHTARLAPKAVLALIRRRRPIYADTTTLKQLEQRMVCSHCGCRGDHYVKVVMLPRNT